MLLNFIVLIKKIPLDSNYTMNISESWIIWFEIWFSTHFKVIEWKWCWTFYVQHVLLYLKDFIIFKMENKYCQVHSSHQYVHINHIFVGLHSYLGIVDSVWNHLIFFCSEKNKPVSSLLLGSTLTLSCLIWTKTLVAGLVLKSPYCRFSYMVIYLKHSCLIFTICPKL